MTTEERMALDAEVHRKVFGRECRPLKWGPWFAARAGQPILDVPQRDLETRESIPRYSADIAAAWRVVEWLVANTPNQDFHLEHLGESGWSVGTCGREEWVTADTAPVAICRAALEAVKQSEG